MDWMKVKDGLFCAAVIGFLITFVGVFINSPAVGIAGGIFGAVLLALWSWIKPELAWTPEEDAIYWLSKAEEKGRLAARQEHQEQRPYRHFYTPHRHRKHRKSKVRY